MLMQIWCNTKSFSISKQTNILTWLIRDAKFESEIKMLNKFLEDEKERSADLETKLQESL